MGDEIEIDDVEDALKRADELAELTGRNKRDIIADLLDDGQLNYSAGEDAKTKKDILDVANEQAVKIKKLLTTLIPIMLLVAGTGAEGLGVVDVTGWGQESVWDDENSYQEPDSPKLWGCTDPAAINYEDWANEDDGSCDYEEEPSCVPNWLYDDNSYLESNDILIVFTFYDGHECEIEIDGHFIIEIYINDTKSDEGFVNVGYFTDSVNVTYEFNDLDAGAYTTEISLHEVACETGVCQHDAEWTMEQNPTFNMENEEIEGCTDDTATNYDSEATDDDGSCEYPPPQECEPILYSAYPFYQNNNTTVSVSFDIDCTNTIDERLNVTVQWLAWHNGTNQSNSEGPANWTTADYTIQGEEWDEYNLSLSNFTNGSYDLCLYILWGGGVEESDYIERKWLNIQIRSEENE